MTTDNTMLFPHSMRPERAKGAFGAAFDAGMRSPCWSLASREVLGAYSWQGGESSKDLGPGESGGGLSTPSSSLTP